MRKQSSGGGKSGRMGSKRKVRTVPCLEPAGLRWRCDPSSLTFESTAEVEPVTGVVGQDTAVEALRYGLEVDAPGQNVFVRGLTGTGRLTLVRRQLKALATFCPYVKDCCYVHNFSQPDRPRLVVLPPGRGKEFQRRVHKLADFVRNHLEEVVSSDTVKARLAVLEQEAKKRIEALVMPFEQALEQAGLKLVTFQAGAALQTAIFPVLNGEAVPPEKYDQLHGEGKVDDAVHEKTHRNMARFSESLEEINEQVVKVRREHEEGVRGLLESSIRMVLNRIVRETEKDFPGEGVRTFLEGLVEDAVYHRIESREGDGDFTRRWRVNVVLDHGEDGACPIVAENAPTVRNLLGTIDYEYGPGDEARSSHMGIRAGSLLAADGGYLVLEARDVLAEPGAWKVLVRTLRTGKVEILSLDRNAWPGPALKPEPIPVKVKVVLLGDAETYAMLDRFDPDFPQLFKVLADFDPVFPRTLESVQHYAEVLARIAQDAQLPPFDRTAVAALAEHGARIAAHRDKLTARFGRISDIAREAAYLAVRAGRSRVLGEDVGEAVRRGKRRADLPARRFRELVADGTIRVQTQGTAVGQINGLAVIGAGPMIYGFPARITATIGPGTAGVINIERESALSGAIHTKGFYILGGLLRHLLRTNHPLAFDASVAFEQSYGGIDGDSASGAEMCCLLSALTGIPLRQDLAMTGAIDQMGHVLAVGAVNEKIEGFFDTCRDRGLTGTQGVVIPRANAGDLVLREDVVESCARGRFHVYAVETIHEALALFTGRSAGERDAKGNYGKDTVLGAAMRRARDFWLKAAGRPAVNKKMETSPTHAGQVPPGKGADRRDR